MRFIPSIHLVGTLVLFFNQRVHFDSSNLLSDLYLFDESPINHWSSQLVAELIDVPATV